MRKFYDTKKVLSDIKKIFFFFCSILLSINISRGKAINKYMHYINQLITNKFTLQIKSQYIPQKVFIFLKKNHKSIKSK